MAIRYDVGFVYPRDKVSPEMISILEKTFKNFDHDFPALVEETVWRSPLCTLKDVIDFCTLVTGEVFKGWLQFQDEWRYNTGRPSDDKLEAGQPVMGRIGKELVWHFIPLMPDYCDFAQFSLCQKLVRMAYGDEFTSFFLIFAQPFDDKFYYLDKEEIHKLFYGFLFP